jgi:hypothetical protein
MCALLLLICDVIIMRVWSPPIDVILSRFFLLVHSYHGTCTLLFFVLSRRASLPARCGLATASGSMTHCEVLCCAVPVENDSGDGAVPKLSYKTEARVPRAPNPEKPDVRRARCPLSGGGRGPRCGRVACVQFM